jgi:hypothetical protein
LQASFAYCYNTNSQAREATGEAKGEATGEAIVVLIKKKY